MGARYTHYQIGYIERIYSFRDPFGRYRLRIDKAKALCRVIRYFVLKKKKRVKFAYFDHRAFAALFAISFFRFTLSFFARACPPTKPPSLPRATAAGFFSSVAFLAIL